MTDGWEYYAAKDLNIKAVPYPGKRPFPNALDPSRRRSSGGAFSQYDFDGDGLTTLEEYRAWRYTGSSFDASKAGGLGPRVAARLQRRHEVQPRERGAGRAGVARPRTTASPNPAQPFPATYDLHGDARAGATTSATRTPTASRTASRPLAAPASASLVGRLLRRRSAAGVEPLEAEVLLRPVTAAASGRLRPASLRGARPGRPRRRRRHAARRRGRPGQRRLQQHHRAVRGRATTWTATARGDDPAWCGNPADLIPSIDRGGDGLGGQRRSTRARRIRPPAPARTGHPLRLAVPPSSSSSNLAPAPSLVGCGRHVFAVRNRRASPTVRGSPPSSRGCPAGLELRP